MVGLALLEVDDVPSRAVSFQLQPVACRLGRRRNKFESRGTCPLKASMLALPASTRTRMPFVRLHASALSQRPLRTGCLVGHLLPCAALASRSLLSAAVFRKSQYGRPYVELPTPGPSFDYNISHDAYVACAYQWSEDGFPQAPLGVDVVNLRGPWQGATPTDFFEAFSGLMSDFERRKYHDRAPEERMGYLTRLWAHKEAWSKACGLGMHDGWSGTTIDLDATPARLLEDGISRPAWHFVEHQASPNHLVVVAQAASLTSPLEVRLWSFDDLVLAARQGY
jgi:phosphopantetheinyl transferase